MKREIDRVADARRRVHKRYERAETPATKARLQAEVDQLTGEIKALESEISSLIRRNLVLVAVKGRSAEGD